MTEQARLVAPAVVLFEGDEWGLRLLPIEDMEDFHPDVPIRMTDDVEIPDQPEDEPDLVDNEPVPPRDPDLGEEQP